MRPRLLASLAAIAVAVAPFAVSAADNSWSLSGEPKETFSAVNKRFVQNTGTFRVITSITTENSEIDISGLNHNCTISVLDDNGRVKTSETRSYPVTATEPVKAWEYPWDVVGTKYISDDLSIANMGGDDFSFVCDSSIVEHLDGEPGQAADVRVEVFAVNPQYEDQIGLHAASWVYGDPVDEPTDPTVDPSEEPVDPVDEPTDPTVDPSEEPVDPSEEPVDPVDEPTDPTVDPSEEPVDPVDPVDPSEEPVDPSEEPVDPVDPVDPSEEPVDPVDPVDPSEEPVDPSEEPVDPVDPVDPSEEPVDPSEEPTDPTVDPSEEPVDPVDEPTDPTVDPSEEPVDPVDEPTDPTVEPVAPSTDHVPVFGAVDEVSVGDVAELPMTMTSNSGEPAEVVVVLGEQTEEFTMEPGATVDLTFSYVASEPGSHLVQPVILVNGEEMENSGWVVNVRPSEEPADPTVEPSEEPTGPTDNTDKLADPAKPGKDKKYGLPASGV